MFGLVRGGARTTARMRAIPAAVQHLLCSRADRCPLTIRRGYDTVIVADLMHLKEPPTSIGPEPAMDYACQSGVGHAVRG